MPLFKFNNQVQNNAPSTPVESNSGSADDNTTNSMASTPSSHQSSPGGESCDPGGGPSSSPSSSSRGGTTNNNNNVGNARFRRRLRRRGVTPRNQEKRPYHSPNHISPPHDKPMTKNDIYFALDCEMVGVGPEGLDSAVARVTICNWAEKVILDTFVKVPVEVTDYRTFVSGIEAKDLESDNAMSLTEVQKLVKSILHGKILIGHALENDLDALQITHPWHDIRDSANYPPLMKESEADKTILRPRKLKDLAQDKLGRDIQTLGEAHDPIEDARAALALYKSERMEWEKYIMKKVANAPVKEEGRESQPSGRGSPPSQLQQPALNSTGVGGYQLQPQHTQPPPQHDPNMSYSYPMYHRSRSAPLPVGMAPHHHQAYGQHQHRHQQHPPYYPPHHAQHQQHFLY